MEFIFYRHWDIIDEGQSISFLTNDLVENLKLSGLKHIVIAAPEEPPYTKPYWFQSNACFEFRKYIKEHDIRVDFITASDIVPVEYQESFNIHNWYTYFLNLTLYVLASNNTNVNFDYSNPKYKFLCLNRKSKLHRKILMDYLQYYNQIEGNCVSYLNHLEVEPYDFKYWTPTKLRVPERENEAWAEGWTYTGSISTDYKSFPAFKFVAEWQHCMFKVLPETAHRVFYLSEKTSKSLFARMPFVSLGCQNHSQKLKDLGFELYDELFDYSFDKEPDLETRCKMLAEMVSKIEFEQCREILPSLKEKLDYNFNHAVNTALNNLNMPDSIKDMLPYLKDNDDFKITTNLTNMPLITNYLNNIR